MDLKDQLQKCFDKLGYNHNFPALYMNPSTSYIWQQLLNRLRPKDEVDKCRRNIMINRLRKNRMVQDRSQRPIPEIKVYFQFKKEKEKVSESSTRIQEKHNETQCLMEANRSQYLLNSSMRKNIDEKKLRIHTLLLKCDLIRSDIKHIDETLNKRDNIFLSEEDSLPEEVRMQRIHNVVEKIEKLVNLQHHDNQMISQKNVSSISQAVPPKKSCYSTIKKAKIGTTLSRKFGSYTTLSSARNLFGDSFKENQMNIENVLARNDDSTAFDMSAELLPESCFQFKSDEEFLTSFKSYDTNQIIAEDSMMDYSSNMCSKGASQTKKKWELFQEAISNKEITDILTQLFEGVNRQLLWNSVCTVRENVIAQMRNSLGNSMDNVRSLNVETNEEELAKLRFIIIKYNLSALKSKKINKKLKEAIAQKKSEVERYIREHVEENRLKSLEWKIDEIKFDSTEKFIQKELSISDKSDSLNTIKKINDKIKKSKADMLCKVREIEGYMESKEILVERLRQCKDDTFSLVRKSSKFVRDSSWSSILCEDMHSYEMGCFKRFSFSYNKAFRFTSQDVHYRDTLENVTVDENTPPDVLYMITSLLEKPYCRPERIISEAFKKRDKLKVIQSLEFPKITIAESQHSLTELQERDKYVPKACETFISHLRSSKSHHVLSTPSEMRRTMDLWLEMPFKDLISDEKLVEGKSYKTYELGKKK